MAETNNFDTQTRKSAIDELRAFGKGMIKTPTKPVEDDDEIHIDKISAILDVLNREKYFLENKLESSSLTPVDRAKWLDYFEDVESFVNAVKMDCDNLEALAVLCEKRVLKMKNSLEDEELSEEERAWLEKSLVAFEEMVEVSFKDDTLAEQRALKEEFGIEPVDASPVLDEDVEETGDYEQSADTTEEAEDAEDVEDAEDAEDAVVAEAAAETEEDEEADEEYDEAEERIDEFLDAVNDILSNSADDEDLKVKLKEITAQYADLKAEAENNEVIANIFALAEEMEDEEQIEEDENAEIVDSQGEEEQEDFEQEITDGEQQENPQPESVSQPIAQVVQEPVVEPAVQPIVENADAPRVERVFPNDVAQTQQPVEPIAQVAVENTDAPRVEPVFPATTSEPVIQESTVQEPAVQQNVAQQSTDNSVTPAFATEQQTSVSLTEGVNALIGVQYDSERAFKEAFANFLLANGDSNPQQAFEYAKFYYPDEMTTANAVDFESAKAVLKQYQTNV